MVTWACQVAARAPPLRTLTPQVAARARRPHRHLKGPPAHRRATTPPSTQPPRHTATQAPTVGSIIPAVRTREGRALPAAPQKTPHREPPRPKRSPLHPKHPMSPGFHRGGLHFEQALGGFATIDPRHAGDTPQRSAYGSNSPQATNENKPHHTNTRATPPQTSATASPTETPPARPRRPRNTTRRRNHAQTVVHYTPNTPCHPHVTEVDCTLSNHAGGFATIEPRHADDTPQRSAYGSNSPKPPTKTTQATTTPETYHQTPQQTQATTRGRNRATEQPRGGFCDHRPPTRRRHAARQRLW